MDMWVANLWKYYVIQLQSSIRNNTNVTLTGDEEATISPEAPRNAKLLCHHQGGHSHCSSLPFCCLVQEKGSDMVLCLSEIKGLGSMEAFSEVMFYSSL